MTEKRMGIREASAETGLPAYVLRQWEDRFPELHPPRDKAGRRTYREQDIRLIRRIKELHHHEGLSTEGVNRRLRLEKMGEKKIFADQEALDLLDDIIDRIDAVIDQLQEPIPGLDDADEEADPPNTARF